jgi:hypothetical protein
MHRPPGRECWYGEAQEVSGKGFVAQWFNTQLPEKKARAGRSFAGSRELVSGGRHACTDTDKMWLNPTVCFLDGWRRCRVRLYFVSPGPYRSGHNDEAHMKREIDAIKAQEGTDTVPAVSAAESS